MKQQLCATALIFSLCAMAAPDVSSRTIWDGSVDTEWSGDGTAESPYLISSAAELAGLAKRTNDDENFAGKYFKLTDDIWLSDEATPADQRPLWTPIGNYTLVNDDPETNPGGISSSEHWFRGNFDGNGHTIYNLWYSGTTDFDEWNDPFGSGQLDFTAWNKALFGLMDGASVKNLRLENGNVAGTALIGGLVIRARSSSFTDIFVGGSYKSGDLEAGGSAAALAVEAYDSHFTRCSTDAKVYARSATGSLIGHLFGASTVTDCSVSGEVSGAVYVGGLIGSATTDPGATSGDAPVITRSTSSALVTVIVARNQGDMGAGFIGFNEGTISRCSATGNVHVLSHSGAGFCNDNRGTIESCYATGNVYNEAGGSTLCAFVTDNGTDAGYSEYYPGTILNCYGSGHLGAPDASGDVVASPTHISGFAWINAQEAGSRMANCYYDSTSNPTIYGIPAVGSFGATTEYMQSQEFVDRLNFMAALMGTYLWQHVPGGYPVPTDVKATATTPFFGGGDGSEASPYLISTKAHLENLAYATNRNWNFTGQHIRQTADILLNEPQENWGETMPAQWTPIAVYTHAAEGERYSYHFCGNYDGAFHTVANLYIDNDNLLYAGLFGLLGKGAVIRNLGVTGAWVSAGYYAGLIAGANRVHNDSDQYKGDVTITRCWSSGTLAGTMTGGILGYAAGNGNTSIDACFSTAAPVTHALIGSDNSSGETAVNGSWFAARSESTAFEREDNLFWSFVDSDLDTRYRNNAAIGRPTAYMQSPRFVNDLNYAATAKGVAGGWGFNEGAYPSFTGVQPTLTVTVDDGVNEPFSFKAFTGSTLSRPASPQREGQILLGWYTDESLTELFEFGVTKLTGDITLHARWAETYSPDYSIFGNKFTKTFTITTPAQLYAFANIVNGTAEGIDRSDFEGKTVKLGNDIVINDPSGFDNWGSQIVPLTFPSIGVSYPFQGTFDGQGHAIVGLYLESDMNSTNRSFFTQVGRSATISNVVLRSVLVNKNKADISTALFVNSLSGTMSRCGAEGRIVETVAGTSGAECGGLVATAAAGASISECYADITVETSSDRVGGLVSQNSGSIINSYAVGSVSYTRYGNFGGVTCRTEAPFTDCYSAIAVSFGAAPDVNASVGGTYGYLAQSGSNPGYYDIDLVRKAFDLVPAANYLPNPFTKGTGLSAIDMQKMASFPGWDFSDMWGRRNDTNNGYPYLRWTSPGLTNDKDYSSIESVGIDPSTRVSVYNLQGTMVFEGEATAIDLPAGIYIVRTAGRAMKHIIR